MNRSFFVELTHALFFGALFVWLERWPAIIILVLDFLDLADYNLP